MINELELGFDESNSECSGFIIDDDGKYNSLFDVLLRACYRASGGKGAERHGDNKKFIDQWILRGLRLFGIGGMQFQIGKKIEEINNLKETEAKVNELLDIIVYAAAGVIYLEEKAGNGKTTMH